MCVYIHIFIHHQTVATYTQSKQEIIKQG